MPAVTIEGELKAHLAVPPVGAGPWPGVVVLHEAFGLNDDIRQQTDRLASAGYVALALDLYSRGGARRCIKGVFRAAMRGEGQALDDIEAGRRWLAAREDCTGRVGVIGFCLGGGFALLTASRGFAASAPNYAHLPKDLDAALQGACPVVASYGAKDRTLRGTAEELRSGLVRAGVEHDVVEYPDAGHSFLNRPDPGPFLRVAGIGYDEASAEDAWGRILRFFDMHLRATADR
jgi:carboxymethylenebutenolidase